LKIEDIFSFSYIISQKVILEWRIWRWNLFSGICKDLYSNVSFHFAVHRG